MKHAIAAALLLSATGLAQAWEIRMDISNSESTTGGNWNNIGDLNGTTSNLIEYGSGAATNVSIFGTGWSDFSGDDDATFANVDWVEQPCTDDGAGVQIDQTGTFTISGLDDGEYTVEIVSARTNFNYLNFITVGSEFADRTYNGTAVNTPWGSTDDGLSQSNWLIWDHVQTDDNEIFIQDVASADTLGMINAIRISRVPAPGAVGLLGVAGIAGLRRRR